MTVSQPWRLFQLLEKFTNVEKQDFDQGLVVRKDVAIGDVLGHLRMQALNGIALKQLLGIHRLTLWIGLFNTDGTYRKPAYAFCATGLMLNTPQRLLASGADTYGLACRPVHRPKTSADTHR